MSGRFCLGAYGLEYLYAMAYNNDVMPEVTEFEREKGDNPFAARLKAIKKKDVSAAIRILARINRAADGNFGDHKSVGKGVSEMRIDYGMGYRIYYGMDGDELVILLLAGAKPCLLYTSPSPRDS